MSRRRNKRNRASTVHHDPLKKQLKPLTINQKIYIDNIKNSDIIFCTGPAGTGKTHIAVAMAIDYYYQGLVEKIILTRPIIESDGEQLGYLPGGIEEKTDPYLRPLRDELLNYISKPELKQLEDFGKIEICPLAYMRGRTFKNCFICADEMQNCNRKQFKMICTRIGLGSKLVISGDTEQSDIHDHALDWAINKLRHLDEVSVTEFENRDIVRHGLISRILRALEDE